MRKMTPIKVTEPVRQQAPAKSAEAATDAYAPRSRRKPDYHSKYNKTKHHAAYHKKRKKKKGWVATLWDELDDLWDDVEDFFDVEDWFD